MSRELPPLPVVDADSARFWAALREHRLVIQRCVNCGRYIFYPRAICPDCYADVLQWVEVSGRGTVYSFTISRRAAGPAFESAVPYVVALVELAEGPRMLARLVVDDLSAVAIGVEVAIQFDDVTADVTLPIFALASGSKGGGS